MEPKCYSCQYAIKRGPFRLCEAGHYGYLHIGQKVECDFYAPKEEPVNRRTGATMNKEPQTRPHSLADGGSQRKQTALAIYPAEVVNTGPSAEAPNKERT